MRCQVCGGDFGKEHLFREMMYGTREEFKYWECQGCGCLQIVEVPENLADHYPSDFYSFALQFSPWKAPFYRAYLKFPRLMQWLHHCGPDFGAVVEVRPRAGARILDVGCGSGKLVDTLRSLGFDACGVDPFLKEERPHLQRMSIEDVDGGWDLIMFHHVLEHMPDSVQVLRCARSRLSEGGICLVRIPVANWAWQQYAQDWVQLDPPRHLVIHTPESFGVAADSAGLRITRTIFDSTEFQLRGSELYRRNVPLSSPAARDFFSPKEIKVFATRAEELNREGKGDQAVFILKAKIE